MFTSTAIVKHDVQPSWLGCSLLPAGNILKAGTEIGVKLIMDYGPQHRLWEVVGGPFAGLWISSAFLSFDLP